MRKLPPPVFNCFEPEAHPDEVHLTVGVVRYNSHGRDRKGVCSSFLADDLPVGQTVDVFVSPNKHFKLPNDPNTPLIMVGQARVLRPSVPSSKKGRPQGLKEKIGSFLATNTTSPISYTRQSGKAISNKAS